MFIALTSEFGETGFTFISPYRKVETVYQDFAVLCFFLAGAPLGLSLFTLSAKKDAAKLALTQKILDESHVEHDKPISG